MANITWTGNVEVLAPELSAVTVPAQDLILAFVHESVLVSEFGGESSELTKMTRTYLAAHFGTLAVDGGANSSGQVQTERAGNLSRSYGVVTLASIESQRDMYITTTYGKIYLGLLRMSGSGLPRII